jgi:general secretion pathway protein A
MYLDFYGFREKPFNLTPDPRFVFLSKPHQEAFAHLLYGINNRAGFIALIGEVGSGKTTVLRALLSQLDADHHRTALIFNPSQSPRRLLQNINREFGIPPSSTPGSGPLEALNSFLLQENAAGRTVLLIIDEAQNLEAPALEQIRMVSNLETDREKLIQIILAGQPELGQILERKDMRQLSQRITVRCHLLPMTFQDTARYIHHRIEVAGGKGAVLFTQGALKRIYRYSQGLPRLINAACDRALLAAYARDTAEITSSIAAAGIRDLKQETGYSFLKRPLIWVPALAVLLVLLAAGLYYAGQPFLSSLHPSAQVQATEQRAKKFPIPEVEELNQTMAAQLGNVSEAESARRAFNTLAGLWKARPIPENIAFNPAQGMESAALDRDLRLYGFSGNLGGLLRIDYPAVLELHLPGIPGKRFLSLVGRKEEKFFVDPPIGGRKSLTFDEAEKYWSGQGFLLWKDPLNLLTWIGPGSRGGHIKRLQGLLREAGTSSPPSTGVYDRDTLSAVKGFQLAKGIDQDGIVGSQTLMLLYGSIDRFGVPRLTAGQK